MTGRSWTIWCAALLGATLALVGCGDDTPPVTHATSGPRVGGRSVYVDSYPMTYFAQRIGGDHIDVTFPAPPDVDPAFWEPDDKAVIAYQSADLILLNGADFAKWTHTHTLPMSKAVETAGSLSDSFIIIKNAVTHSHGATGSHSHAGTDFNTWVDPVQAITQANAVADALKKLQPDHVADFEKNRTALVTDLQSLDDALKSISAGDKAKTPLVASHPVYNYIARRYGWNLRSMLWEPDAMPSDEQWAELGKLLNAHAALSMLWEDEPIAPIRERLETMGLKVIVFRPCGNRPASGDYMTEMRANIERLRAAFE
ncbi:MAG: zinc ABC transporter substrate-binding protein [Phycisphaera sp.]|nr:zinc ABC transporter substrate-binding protein [Phycisphaera sp.]